MKFSVLLLSVTLLLFSVQADAKRMGGSKSVGKQSNNVSQREASPQAPAAPAQNAGNRAGTPPAAAPAPAPKRPWGAMLGGIAAGLGLAWLAHSLGLGAAMGQVLMFILLAVGIMLLVGWWVRRRNAAPMAAPYAFQGANQAPVYDVPNYRPENVGNDASARPFERGNLATDLAPAAAAPSTQGGSMIGSALLGSQSWGVPAGFDTAGFLDAAKRNFVTLQAAWDRSDIASLRAMMTDEMLSEIKIQLSERETHTGSVPNITEVEMLEARLLGIEEMATEYMASVEFSGMIREDRTSGPNPFREVWNMTKSKNNGNGWLVAGVQALQ